MAIHKIKSQLSTLRDYRILLDLTDLALQSHTNNNASSRAAHNFERTALGRGGSAAELKESSWILFKSAFETLSVPLASLAARFVFSVSPGRRTSDPDALTAPSVTRTRRSNSVLVGRGVIEKNNTS